MDIIADMFVRIYNASSRGHEEVSMPYSKFKEELAVLLKEKNKILDFTKKGKGVKRVLVIKLAYQDGQPIINGWQKVSKLGKRIYASWRDIRPVKEGWGLSIISTSGGLLTDVEARKNRKGGEVLVNIW